MSFEDHWQDYHFRKKCGLNVPQFYRDLTFSVKEAKHIARHAYNAGIEDASQKAVQADAYCSCKIGPSVHNLSDDFCAICGGRIRTA